jgi:hypothetical protein
VVFVGKFGLVLILHACFHAIYNRLPLYTSEITIRVFEMPMPCSRTQLKASLLCARNSSLAFQKPKKKKKEDAFVKVKVKDGQKKRRSIRILDGRAQCGTLKDSKRTALG